MIKCENMVLIAVRLSIVTSGCHKIMRTGPCIRCVYYTSKIETPIPGSVIEISFTKEFEDSTSLIILRFKTSDYCKSIWNFQTSYKVANINSLKENHKPGN